MAAKLYTAAEIYTLEADLARQRALSPAVLMQRAGGALLRCVRANWPEAKRILIVAGSGNNGGDGYVLAKLLRERIGCDATVVALAQAKADPARDAAQAWREAGGEIRRWEPGEALPQTDLIVDALFGVGLSRGLESAAAELVEAMNGRDVPVLAVDLPSGLDADSGSAEGAVVRATRTLCLLAHKRGLYTGRAIDCVGSVSFDALETDVSEPAKGEAVPCQLLGRGDLVSRLPTRRRGAHKGDHGHALIVGGDAGMVGAARIAGHAALRSGAGWVSVATRAAHADLLSVGRPELMAHGVEDALALIPLLERATAIALGPGMGQGPWATALLDAVMAFGKPMVIDADALNLLAKTPQALHREVVITPHPGEAARLLGCTAGEIESDRFAAARHLAQRYSAIVVLKGAGSLIDDGERCFVCPYGNPGMASGGSGDALTGVILALMAQGLRPIDAAVAGVLAHALAGDAAAVKGERGLVAGDLIEHLRSVLNP